MKKLILFIITICLIPTLLWAGSTQDVVSVIARKNVVAGSSHVSIDSHSYESPFDGTSNLDGHDSYNGSPAAATTNLPKDVGSCVLCATGDAAGEADADQDYLEDGAFTDETEIYGTVFIKISTVPSTNEHYRIIYFSGNNGAAAIAGLQIRDDSDTDYISFCILSAPWTCANSTVTPSTATWYQARYYLLTTAGAGTLKIRVRLMTEQWAAAEAEQTAGGTLTFNYGSVDKSAIGLPYIDIASVPTVNFDWHKFGTSDYPNDP